MAASCSASMVPGSSSVLGAVGLSAFATAMTVTAAVADAAWVARCFVIERRGRTPTRKRTTSTTAKTMPISKTLRLCIGATLGAVSTSVVAVGVAVGGVAVGRSEE